MMTTRRTTFVTLLVFLIVLELVLALAIFGVNIGVWHSYYTIYFYMPFAVLCVLVQAAPWLVQKQNVRTHELQVSSHLAQM